MKTVVNTNKSLVISASAGTGKTWVIIARLINLLFKNVELSKITVLTFTNDAVQEIRDSRRGIEILVLQHVTVTPRPT